MPDLPIMARKLALRHIRRDAERGFSERFIQSTYHASGCGQAFVDNTGGDEFGAYFVSIGGYYDFDHKTGLMRKRVPPTKVLVTRVCGVEGVWIFSLHELYVESLKGQMSLL